MNKAIIWGILFAGFSAFLQVVKRELLSERDGFKMKDMEPKVQDAMWLADKHGRSASACQHGEE